MGGGGGLSMKLGSETYLTNAVGENDYGSKTRRQQWKGDNILEEMPSALPENIGPSFFLVE